MSNNKKSTLHSEQEIHSDSDISLSENSNDEEYTIDKQNTHSDNDNSINDDDDNDTNNSDNDLNNNPNDNSNASNKNRKRKRVLDSTTVEEFTLQEKQKGLVYLSRIPPYMKPIKVRHLLSQYGEIGRIYLAPEDPLVYRKRVKAGGNKKIKYTEGWVEFLNKHQAKATAQLLQNTPVDPKHKGRGFYASDLWNIKYLKHFKWHHLTEKIAYEKRLRAIQLRSELHDNKKAIESYLQSVDTAKAITEMETKKLKQSSSSLSNTGTITTMSSKLVKNSTTENNNVVSLSSSNITTTITTGKSSKDDANNQDANIRRKFKQKEVLQDKALLSMMTK